MIILGLGSNLGFQLDNLRCAIKLLRQTNLITIKNISPVYQSDALLPANAPVAWNKTFLNLAFSCEIKLQPQQLLETIKKIELTMGRDLAAAAWSPRIIDIDILVWNELIFQENNLCVPHSRITERPFVLWPLLDLLPTWQHPQYDIAEILERWGSRFDGKAPFRTKQISHRVDTPALVGVLNITADSFSDGGDFNTVDKALAQVQKLFAEGAEVIDIGAESTHPGATLITPQQEWAALQPVLQAIQSDLKPQLFKPKISVDTRHVQVAEQAVNIGIDWINDVTGFSDDNMCRLLAASNLQGVAMHSLTIPPSQQQVLSLQQNASEQILTWAKQRLDKLFSFGVKPEQIILDVGIGFSKTPIQSLTLIKEIEKFKTLGVSLLVGHSRKLFLKLFGDTQPKERDFATALLSFYLTQHGVDYLRVHNVALNTQALRIGAEFI